jgi:hypothetical protein
VYDRFEIHLPFLPRGPDIPSFKSWLDWSGVDLAASVKVIPASQLGWRDGCNGYDDGALVFRLIQAEQSRGVSRSVIRDAAVIEHGRPAPFAVGRGSVVAYSSENWVGLQSGPGTESTTRAVATQPLLATNQLP